MELISKKIADYNGSALLIDYGHDGVQKDTLRAFKEHRIADVFEKPGECDLTCDVDFSFLKHVAQKMQGFHKILLSSRFYLFYLIYLKVMPYGPVTQQDFLRQMQIGTRLQVIYS